MNGDAWAAGGELVDDAGVGEFFVDGAGGGGLEKFAETRAGVGVAPVGVSMLNSSSNANSLSFSMRPKTVGRSMWLVNWKRPFQPQMNADKHR